MRRVLSSSRAQRMKDWIDEGSPTVYYRLLRSCCAEGSPPAGHPIVEESSEERDDGLRVNGSYGHPVGYSRLFLTLLTVVQTSAQTARRACCTSHPFHCWMFPELTPEESDDYNTPG